MLGNIFAFDDFELDTYSGELRRSGMRVEVNTLVLRLLEALVQKPGELVTKAELAVLVWNGRAASTSAMTTAMARLRKALKHQRGSREMVLTVHGRGYRFLRPVEVLEPHRQPSASIRVASVPSLVGRERVLQRLGAALTEAGSGSGGLFVLTGESGMGKTRVAEVLGREARSAGFPVAWGYCRELSHAPPLWPLAGALRNLIRQSSAARSVLRESRWLATVPELTLLFPELTISAEAPKPEADALQRAFELGSKYQVFDTVTRALMLAAEHIPYVLILDDLHRADPMSLELLHYLLPELSRTRIFILATLGDEREAAANRPLMHVLAHRNCTCIPLHRLNESEVASYVLELFGDVDRDLCRMVFDMSEGIPSLMTELARQIRHRDSSEVAGLEFSVGELQRARRRIANLDDATREVLTLAAAIGRNFSLSRLQAMSDRDAPALMTSLDAAVAKDLIRPLHDSRTEFVFTHALLLGALNESRAPAALRSVPDSGALDNSRRLAKH